MPNLRRAAGLLGWADTASHWPGIRRIIPRPARAWLCDPMDYPLGMDWTQLRHQTSVRHGRTSR